MYDLICDGREIVIENWKTRENVEIKDIFT